MNRYALAVLGACLCCLFFGYTRGYGVAESRFRALLAEQAEALAQERQAQAEATAETERRIRQRLETESARVAVLAEDLSETRSRLADERRAFNRRLSRVAEDASRHCAGLSADWVHLYNEALGLAAASPSAVGTGAAAGGSAGAGSGVQPGTSVMVSPEDVLAHVRDYGGYCRSLRAQAEALLAVEAGKKKP